MSVSLAELTTTIDNLVSLPGVGVRVNEMANDPACSANEIGAAISQDPALTARLLRIANSPAYGLSTQVNTVSRAVAVIGVKRIRDLVLASSTVNAFAGMPNELVTLENFWRHSLYCGTAARLLGAERGLKDGETLFVAGLLHDIGQLVIFRRLPQEARRALLLSLEGPDEQALHKSEQQVLGFDHAQVGAALLRHWRFPELLIECVEFHHAPGQAQKYPLEVALVHIANSLATLAEIDSVSEDDAVRIDPAAWAASGLDRAVIAPVVRAAREQFAAAQGLFA